MSEWRTDEPPTDGTHIYRRTWSLYRFHPYKPTSQQAKRGIKGRWQKVNEYGGWDNCPMPLGSEWCLADDGLPSPATPSCEVERLREALAEIARIKSEPIGDTGFSTGPAAHFSAAQRIALAALTEDASNA